MDGAVWVVGQVMHRMPEGAVLWRKLGTFLDRGMAASWARHTKADLLLVHEPGMLTPPFGEFGVSTILERGAIGG